MMRAGAGTKSAQICAAQNAAYGDDDTPAFNIRDGQYDNGFGEKQRTVRVTHILHLHGQDVVVCDDRLLQLRDRLETSRRLVEELVHFAGFKERGRPSPRPPRCARITPSSARRS